MDPVCIGGICIDLSLELGSLLIAAVGGVATLLHHLQHRADLQQREQHHQDWISEEGSRSAPQRAGIRP